MNISKKSIVRKGVTLALMSAMVFGTAIPAFAADNITQEIGAGTFIGAGGMTAPPAFPPFASLRIDGESTSNNASSSTLVVDDNEGANGGWTVSMLASDLTSPSGTIGAARVSAQVGTVTRTNNASIAAVTATSAGKTVIGTEQVVLTATSGTIAGTYTSPVTVYINVPARAVADEYAGTITTTTAQTA